MVLSASVINEEEDFNGTGIVENRELDAARALLDVSPSMGATNLYSPEDSLTLQQELSTSAPPMAVELDDVLDTPPMGRPRSGSAGLDALAALASKEQASFHSIRSEENDSSKSSTTKSRPQIVASPVVVASTVSSSSSSDNDDADDPTVSMPPPPPRFRRRPRSSSNPEGMERWDSLSTASALLSRHHFVLPTHILEVELAEACVAVEQHGRRRRSKPPAFRDSIPEDAECLADEESSDDMPARGESTAENNAVVEANLSPDELLRRARSRLLEDMTEGAVTGEKGVLVMPHTLAKYKEIYNKNGRVGIYSPAERAAVISKFNEKRARRIWNKKIRYNCRKSLADRRLRVKGRFVKRSEQEQLARELSDKSHHHSDEDDALETTKTIEDDNTESDDTDMPDVNDPEAGFSPRDDQPYRRLRRHTIT